MRIIKLDDEEIELYVIKKIDGKTFRIPIKVDEGERLDNSRIPNNVIMVKTFNDGVKCFWNKGYPYKKAHYLETAQTIDELLSKLKEREDIDNYHVFNWEDGKQLL